jgi:hypothetical protein
LEDDYPDPAKVQAETQRRDGFHDRLSAVHHGQLTAIAQVNLEANPDIQRTNLTRSTDINEQLKAIPGLVGLLQDLVLNVARYRERLFETYATVDDYTTRSIAWTMSLKYPDGYQAVRDALNAAE